MKEVWHIQDSTTNRISYYHLLFFVVSLPYDRIYSELALISWLIHELIHLRKGKPSRSSLRDCLFLSIVFLLTVAGTLYTRFYGEAFFELERQLAILLFPLLLSVTRLEVARYRLSVTRAMAAGCAVTILYLYACVVRTILAMHLPFSAIFNQAFLNHNFAAPIDMHATYFSMYIALGLAACVYSLLQPGKRNAKWPDGIIAAILALALLQLSSRAVLIATAIIFNVWGAWALYESKKRLRYMLAMAVFTALFAVAVAGAEGLKNRLVLALKDDITEAGIRNNTLEPRITRWKYAVALIRQSPVYGHGSGSEIPLLKEQYFQHQLYNSYIHQLNAHNQYLSIAIQTGCIGLLLYLLFLFIAMRRTIREKDFLFGSFLLLVITVGFSENILDANKGIFFFACYLSLYWFSPGPLFTRK